ncbi:hypothetical protein [Sedimentibacter sp. LTW-03]|uniref:hypothetical protein n=1 Tax=Sedimentibacter sp. LTW-03 TaxID=3453406 RepID=UPI003F84D505
MKKSIKSVRKLIKNQKGDILQWVIVIVAVVAIAIAVMPDMSNKISDQGDKSIDRLGDLDSLITEGK